MSDWTFRVDAENEKKKKRSVQVLDPSFAEFGESQPNLVSGGGPDFCLPVFPLALRDRCET